MSHCALAVVWNKWAKVATRVVVSSCRSWFGPQQEGEVCEGKAECPFNGNIFVPRSQHPKITACIYEESCYAASSHLLAWMSTCYEIVDFFLVPMNGISF
jgi:hypothetical protein